MNVKKFIIMTLWKLNKIVPVMRKEKVDTLQWGGAGKPCGV